MRETGFDVYLALRVPVCLSSACCDDRRLPNERIVCKQARKRNIIPVSQCNAEADEPSAKREKMQSHEVTIPSCLPLRQC